MIVRIFGTWAALDGVSSPGPMKRLSSIPTLRFPPSMAACVAKGIWCRPAARTDHS
ncbi:hypothetical protein D3C57_142020 [Streptomyces rapamycinicus NRRL 5491]|uniref:Uncharacterized protein n=1 Tax=Streptomyces rapamycinicus (strain ATCC 29253 / DSM 41530 / NRRL 5491 / AYB-994) TaxID=1343740 RepID=A0A3L8R929_STRRN|nr:hypothetical protein D3C57_142020 [Streptomyces rapamycinicus NRRL 5491]